MGLKRSLRRKHAGKMRSGSSRKRRLPGLPRGQSQPRPEPTAEFVNGVLKNTAVGNLLALMYNAIRAQQATIANRKGDPPRMEVLLFNSRLCEALIHTRNAYVAEQQGFPQEPKLHEFFEKDHAREEAEAEQRERKIILPHEL